MTYRLVKYKRSDGFTWYEIEKKYFYFFGLFGFWSTMWAGDSDNYSFQYIDDAEKKLNELRFPAMIEKTVLK